MNRHNDSLSVFQNLGAWAGLTDPGLVFTFDVTGARREAVEGAVSILTAGEVKASEMKALIDYDRVPDYKADDVQGRYLVRLSGGCDLPAAAVLQIKPRIPEDSYALADRVYGELSEQGVRAPRLISFPEGRLVESLRDYRICFSTYREGQHLKPDNASHMFSLGKLVAQLENGMLALSSEVSGAVHEKGRELRGLVLDGCDFTQAEGGGSLLRKEFGERAGEILSLVEPYVEASRDCVPAHGDMIPGNVIIDAEGEVALLDFDNISGSVFRRGHDLGMAIGRVALDQGYKADAGGYGRRIGLLVDGYNSVAAEGLSIEDAAQATRLSMVHKAFNCMGQYRRTMDSDVRPISKVRTHANNFLMANALLRDVFDI